MKVPDTEDACKLIAENFRVLLDYPHCIWAIDGKHVKIQAPPKSGSLYFNCKGTI